MCKFVTACLIEIARDLRSRTTLRVTVAAVSQRSSCDQEIKDSPYWAGIPHPNGLL